MRIVEKIATMELTEKEKKKFPEIADKKTWKAVKMCYLQKKMNLKDEEYEQYLKKARKTRLGMIRSGKITKPRTMNRKVKKIPAGIIKKINRVITTKLIKKGTPWLEGENILAANRIIRI